MPAQPNLNYTHQFSSCCVHVSVTMPHYKCYNGLKNEYINEGVINEAPIHDNKNM